MTFRKKAMILSALLALLVLANLLTFVFDPGKPRSSSFAWLDPSLVQAADHIELYGRDSINNKGDSGDPVVLIRRNNRWLFRGDGIELPVKQSRVEDLLSALSRKAVYPGRAASREASAALALDEGRSSRILVRGGAGLPLLDLLVGTADALGREVYLRKAGRSEIHSGEDLFTVYTESKPVSWYDLKLFSGGGAQDKSGAVTAENVQQIELNFFEAGLSGEGAEKRSYMLRRQRNGWIMPGNESALIDSQRVDAWLRAVLEAEAEDFSREAPGAPWQSITLRLGDGSTRVIQAGAPDEMKSRNAILSGSNLVYVLTERTLSRLFREASYFSANP